MTVLACLSVPSHRVPIGILEVLACPGDELPAALRRLHKVPGTHQVLLLSTCERTEVYALCESDTDPTDLMRALAEHRAVPVESLLPHVSRHIGSAAARHLFRVASGIESFVVGESDIVAQVRRAAEVAQAEATSGLELDRLVGAAVSTSRRVHRTTAFGTRAGSVAGSAVHAVAGRLEHGLAGRSVIVVGAGQVAASALVTARELGARVSLCNRSAAGARRLAPAGMPVHGLQELEELLTDADVVVFGTSAPYRLLDAARVGAARRRSKGELVVVDLCVPRNVDPDVRSVAGVRLLDLTDLRNSAPAATPASAEVERAAGIVEEEVDRFVRWLGGRAGAESVRRLRADVDACVRLEITRATRGLPDELAPLVAERVRRAVYHLAHQPTRRLLDAAADGDQAVVDALAAVFAPRA